MYPVVKRIIVNNRSKIVCVVCISLISTLNFYGEDLSFNALYSKSWYEKALNEAIMVWNDVSFINKDMISNSEEWIDVFMGRCAFICFCLEKMYHNKQRVYGDDIIYLAVLFDKLQCYFKVQLREVGFSDKIEYLLFTVARMRELLQVQGNVEAE